MQTLPTEPTPTLYEQLKAPPEGLTREVLSSSTESKDRNIKMPVYARYGVKHLWLIDPRTRTLEAYTATDGAWQEIGRWRGDQAAAAA